MKISLCNSVADCHLNLRPYRFNPKSGMPYYMGVLWNENKIFLKVKTIKGNLISGSKCHNILWRHYIYGDSHPKLIRIIFCDVTLHSYEFGILPS